MEVHARFEEKRAAHILARLEGDGAATRLRTRVNSLLDGLGGVSTPIADSTMAIGGEGTVGCEHRAHAYLVHPGRQVVKRLSHSFLVHLEHVVIHPLSFIGHSCEK